MKDFLRSITIIKSVSRKWANSYDTFFLFLVLFKDGCENLDSGVHHLV